MPTPEVALGSEVGDGVDGEVISHASLVMRDHRGMHLPKPSVAIVHLRRLRRMRPRRNVQSGRSGVAVSTAIDRFTVLHFGRAVKPLNFAKLLNMLVKCGSVAICFRIVARPAVDRGGAPCLLHAVLVLLFNA